MHLITLQEGRDQVSLDPSLLYASWFDLIHGFIFGRLGHPH
jgi:hypothetical protein